MFDRPGPKWATGRAKRVYLVDGSLYVFRAWQSGPLQLDAYGRPCNAVRGFAAWLIALLDSAAGHPLACFYDAHDGRSRRRDVYPPYKADRPPVDPQLLCQINDCATLCTLLGIPTLRSSNGLEADDLIAACAVVARQAEAAVTVVSGDKDLAQILARDDDHWWDSGRRAPLDRRGVEKRFGVRPEQIPDWLALAGDASDNIPGVPGIGPPTAARLLRHWGDLDTLFANVADVAGMRFRGAPNIARLLSQHQADVRLARQLTGALPVAALTEPELTDPERLFTHKTPVEHAQLLNLGLDEPLARDLRTRCLQRCFQRRVPVSSAP